MNANSINLLTLQPLEPMQITLINNLKQSTIVVKLIFINPLTAGEVLIYCNQIKWIPSFPSFKQKLKNLI